MKLHRLRLAPKLIAPLLFTLLLGTVWCCAATPDAPEYAYAKQCANRWFLARNPYADKEATFQLSGQVWAACQRQAKALLHQ